MTLGSIGSAPLRLNALGIKDARLTSAVLTDRITYHYKQEVLRQLYRVLGSADFLGNPVGLFTNVSSGVADIFYEPWKGVVMHGNKELGVGIAKVCSFVCSVYIRGENLMGCIGCGKLREEDGLRGHGQYDQSDKFNWEGALCCNT